VTIDGRIARFEVEERFRNTGRGIAEGTYHYPMPGEALFTDFSLFQGEKELKGETLRVDTGCLVGMQPSVDYDIEYVGKIKTALFGGEGLFFATLRGPGTVYLQSLPLSRLASRIFAAAPQRGGSREEGSVLGGLLGGAALGGLLGGDDE